MLMPLFFAADALFFGNRQLQQTPTDVNKECPLGCDAGFCVADSTSGGLPMHQVPGQPAGEPGGRHVLLPSWPLHSGRQHLHRQVRATAACCASITCHYSTMFFLRVPAS